MTTTPIPTGPTGPTGAAGPNKLLIALIAVGSVLVLVIVAVVFFVVGQNNGGSGGNDNAGAPTPLASQTPQTPVAEPTDETTDQNSGGDSSSGGGGTDTSLRFTSFNANPQVACDYNADEKAQPQISWSAANATAVYWTPSNREATADNGYKVGSSGNQNDMSASKGPGERYEFPCAHEQTFDTTITIYGSNGQKVSKTVTFTDTSWGQGGGDEDE